MRLILLLIIAALCMGTGFVGSKGSHTGGKPANLYAVTYNPYAGVDLTTANRQKTSIHSHPEDTAADYDAAGYEAMTWSHYSGGYSTGGGPCVCKGWCNGRAWPAEDNAISNAPAISGMTNLLFYILGSEETGLNAVGGGNSHTYSLFMEEYIMGPGCPTCNSGGPLGIVATCNPTIDPANVYVGNTSNGMTLDLLDTVKEVDPSAFLMIAHPTSVIGAYTNLTQVGGIAIYNNLYGLQDEFNADTVFQDAFRVAWDAVLSTFSPKIWGISSNDHKGPSLPLVGSTPPYPVITTANRDAGYIVVLSPGTTYAEWETSFRAGAFFSMKDAQFPKEGGPNVETITVTDTTISLTTTDDDETLTWRANNGEILDTDVGPAGFSFDLSALAHRPDYTYVRATLVDAQGRKTWVQPFSVQTVAPGTRHIR